MYVSQTDGDVVAASLASRRPDGAGLTVELALFHAAFSKRRGVQLAGILSRAKQCGRRCKTLTASCVCSRDASWPTGQGRSACRHPPTCGQLAACTATRAPPGEGSGRRLLSRAEAAAAAVAARCGRVCVSAIGNKPTLHATSARARLQLWWVGRWVGVRSEAQQQASRQGRAAQGRAAQGRAAGQGSARGMRCDETDAQRAAVLARIGHGPLGQHSVISQAGVTCILLRPGTGSSCCTPPHAMPFTGPAQPHRQQQVPSCLAAVAAAAASPERRDLPGSAARPTRGKGSAACKSPRLAAGHHVVTISEQ